MNMEKDIKGFIKTWWHCLWRQGHRMCKITYPDINDGTHWACSCEVFSYKEEKLL